MTRTVLQGGSVFDGTGDPPVRADVAFENGRIVAVGGGLRGDVTYDLSGHAVLPGLVDSHVEVLGEPTTADDGPFSGRFYAVVGRLARLLDVGVTTARDCGSADPGLRVALRDGLVEGPRLRVSIASIELGGTGDDWGHGRRPLGSRAIVRPGQLLAGPDEHRRAVRTLVRAGADHVRLVCLDPEAVERDAVGEELEAAVAEARGHGLPVVVRTGDDEVMLRALRCGVRAIEHEGPLGDAVAGALLAADARLVPVGDRPWASRTREAREPLLKRIAIGSAGPGGDVLDALSAIASGGVPLERALVAATSAGAELLGLADDVGTIAPGKRADAVIVAGDPREPPELRGRIRAVFQDGVLVRG